MQPTNSEEEIQTGDQRIHQAAGNPSPTGLDALLQKIMDPHIQSQQLDTPKSLLTSKRPRNKKKDKNSKLTGKSTYQPPKADSAAAEQDTQLPAHIEPELKRRKLDKKESPKDKYHSPKRAPKNMKETRQDQPDNIQLR